VHTVSVRKDEQIPIGLCLLIDPVFTLPTSYLFMNRLCFLGFFCLLSQLVAAQVYVNDVNINAEPITYCQLEGHNGSVLNRTRLWLDYGQPYDEQPNAFRNQVFKGPDQRPVRFSSVVDALNFMTANGWELVSMQAARNKDSLPTYIYLLRKRIK
jgi:hypothetical protein